MKRNVLTRTTLEGIRQVKYGSTTAFRFALFIICNGVGNFIKFHSFIHRIFVHKFIKPYFIYMEDFYFIGDMM